MSEAVIVEPAESQADIAAAAALWVDVDAVRAGEPFTPEYIEEQRAGVVQAMQQVGAWLFVARSGTEVVGLVGGFPPQTGDTPPGSTPEHGYLAWLAVTPERWGTGIADALMAEADALFLRLGLSDVVLWVHEDNPRARRYYERRGWTLTGTSMRTPVDNDLLLEYRLIIERQ